MLAVEAGCHPMEIKKGLNRCGSALIQALEILAEPINSREELHGICLVSTNYNEHLAGLVAECLHKLGSDGRVTLEESLEINSHLQFVNGMTFNRGIAHAQMITDRLTSKLIIDYPLILVVGERVEEVDEIIPALDAVCIYIYILYLGKKK